MGRGMMKGTLPFIIPLMFGWSPRSRPGPRLLLRLPLVERLLEGGDRLRVGVGGAADLKGLLAGGDGLGRLALRGEDARLEVEVVEVLARLDRLLRPGHRLR